MDKESAAVLGDDGVIRVFLVNGESRSLRVDDRTEPTEVVKFILHRLHVNMDVGPKLFGLQLKHTESGEAYWLPPGHSMTELVHQYCGLRPLEEWRFLLKIRVYPKTPQHLLSQDPVTFQYFYDQVLHTYLEDESIKVDLDASIKLGCLELRRFYKDMPQIALKKRENFTMLEREIGLEKFFKKSLLASIKKRTLRSMVLSAFQQYENLTMEACVFQFFNLLGKHHTTDVEAFSNCALGDDSSLMTCQVFVGPNCEVEYMPENKERRFLVAFNDIQDISYEAELMSRGRVTMELKAGPPVVIRTAKLLTAVHLSTLIDAYCMCYTSMTHSRMSTGRKRFSVASRLSGIYSTADDFRPPIPEPSFPYQQQDFAPDDYAEVKEPAVGHSRFNFPLLQVTSLVLLDKIGEGQFGDVHKGVLYPESPKESLIAVKTCKEEASREDRAKFLEEATVMAKFEHPHIIKLFGVVLLKDASYIVMELASLGQLRRYLLNEGQAVSKTMLLEYILQLTSALVYLERKNYVHRDIAARNILVSTPLCTKLADFGLSRGLEDLDYYVSSHGKLPIKWMAPESINFRRFTGLSDVWMFGVCCWEILMRGVKPFVGIKNDDVINKIELGERLPLPQDCPLPLFRLLNLCWQYDPADRPTFSDIENILGDIMEEERELDQFNQRRAYGSIQPDPLAPRKPDRFDRSVSGSSLMPKATEQQYEVDETPPTLPPRKLSDTTELEANPLPLPPRMASRFRDTSVSPVGGERSSLSPPFHPSPSPHSHSGGSRSNITPDRLPPPHLHPPTPHITPYSVTTLAPRGNISAPPPPPPPTNAMNDRIFNAPIPPPSIIRQSGPPAPVLPPQEHESLYYSVPEETRVHLSQDGTFSTSDQRPGSTLSNQSNQSGGYTDRSLRNSRKLSTTSHTSSLDEPPQSHSPLPSSEWRGSREQGVGGGASGGGSEEGEGGGGMGEEEEVVDENDGVLKGTTGVVQAVMDLSNKIHKARPQDYVELVMNVGVALRTLLSRVDEELKELPQQTHSEVSMAHKVLSSDMNQLVAAMKNAQSNYQTFLEEEYQKQMLKAAHIVAFNSKQLLDAVGNARRKALKLQR